MDSLVLDFYAVYWMHDFTGRKIGDILLRWQKHHLKKVCNKNYFLFPLYRASVQKTVVWRNFALLDIPNYVYA